MTLSQDPDWRSRLLDATDPDLTQQIDTFAQQVALKKKGELDDKLFAETRLRRGAYGQRYDNGQRHDGAQNRKLSFPTAATKGPNTEWDAPGMMRIKIPYGDMTAAQLECLSEVAEEYGDGILHVTTRQDIQIHFIHVEESIDLMRRLAAAGITTQEACGNTVRNITACPTSGVCETEAFDVSIHAEAITRFLLGHPDAQNFGRKFKVSFSGCSDKPCGLAHIHDMGFIARVREGKKGFSIYVGGGLGAVPHQAQLYADFVDEVEIFPLTQAMCRVFAAFGEKKSRGRARMKFLIAKWGMEKFREEVEKARKEIPDSKTWATHLESAREILATTEPTVPTSAPSAEKSDGFDAWAATNVAPQKQVGFNFVTLNLPLGDFDSAQALALADIARDFSGGSVRNTVEQNIVLRNIPDSHLVALHTALSGAGLSLPGAGTITDITACPGTDTCKLGISASRGLAAELVEHIGRSERPDSTSALRVKASGCFNSCSQHHVADIGFYGVGRKKNGYQVPHFQVVVGGQWDENAKEVGLAIGAVPSKRIPEALDKITARFEAEKEPEEKFHNFVKRVGKAEIKKELKDLLAVAPFEDAPDLYYDWGDPRQFNMDDHGIGECAGEIVSPAEFALSLAEREVFDAQIALDGGDAAKAKARAFDSMLTAADGLLQEQKIYTGKEPDKVVQEFRTHFYDTEVFFDPFAKGKFARYFFAANDEASSGATDALARQRVEEAQLFIEAAHSCFNRMEPQETEEEEK